MTYKEAQQHIDKLESQAYVAKLVRILPREIDPIKKGDNGWDVEITMLAA